MNPISIRRAVAAVGMVAAAVGLSACSSGYVETTPYSSPIAATPAPAPVVPVASAPSAQPHGRLPLLPPVPADYESRQGLPPVHVAAVAEPPPVSIRPTY